MIKEKLKENQELGEQCGLQYKYGGQVFWKETLEKGFEGSQWGLHVGTEPVQRPYGRNVPRKSKEASGVTCRPK